MFQKKSQIISDYVANLKDLAKTCDVGATKPGKNFFTIDWFVWKSGTGHTMMFVGRDKPGILTFDKALEMALVVESAAIDMAQLHS